MCVVIYRSEEGVIYSVFGTSMSTLHQYMYLDLVMTTDLSFTAIVQGRKEQTINAYHAL